MTSESNSGNSQHTDTLDGYQDVDRHARQAPSGLWPSRSSGGAEAGHWPDEGPGAPSSIEQRSRDFVRDRPIAAVLAAAGIGYVLARMASRRTR